MNPYLAFAALLAAGLYGIENELELGPALEGNAYESGADRFPSTLREAIAALESGTMARAALGDDVVEHYLNYARTEQALFDKVVDELGAGAVVRAGVSRVDRDHDVPDARREWGAVGAARGADPGVVRALGGARRRRAAARAAAAPASPRRSTRSTG